jgi:hypothetical protein
MNVEKHTAEDGAPSAPDRETQIGKMALILTSGFVSTNPVTLLACIRRKAGKRRTGAVEGAEEGMNRRTGGKESPIVELGLV